MSGWWEAKELVIVRHLLLALAVISAALSGACSREDSRVEGRSAGSRAQVRWHTSLDDARAEATRTGRPVLAAFYAPDCLLCKAMDDSTYSSPHVTRLLDEVVMVRLSIEADTLLSSSFHVREHPTAVFLRPDGEEIDRVVGYVNPRAFLIRGQNILAGRRTLADLLGHEEEHRDDTPYLMELAQKFYHRGESREAVVRLSRIWEVDPQNRRGATDQALFLWGRVLGEEGRHSDSIDLFGRLIEHFPRSSLFPQARLYRAMEMLGVEGRGQEGTAELRAIQDDYPETPLARWAAEQLAILQLR